MRSHQYYHPCVGPFAQRRLNETFGFSVGFRRIGLGSQVLDLQPSTGLREGEGSISRPIVGHDARDFDAEARVIDDGGFKKRGGALRSADQRHAATAN
jgi:hypothetical protein